MRVWDFRECVVVVENNSTHNLVKIIIFSFGPPFSIFYRSPVHFMLREDRGETIGGDGIKIKDKVRSMAETPPPFQEASRCDVCNCSFNTFRRRVPSSSSSPSPFVMPTIGRKFSRAIYFFDHLSILLMPNYSKWS